MGYIGQPLPRRDDLRLTTGGGRYVSDLAPPGTLHLALVRSTHAHARVLAVDSTPAEQVPGVVAVLTPEDVRPIMRPLPAFPSHPSVDRFRPLPLADKVVRYVGEPVAAVLAVDRYAAEDAAEAVRVQYEPLPAVVDAERADEAGGFLFPEHGSNVVAKVGYTTGKGQDALRDAALVVHAHLRLGRVVAHAMEPRAVLAVPEGDTLTVYLGTQSVHRLRDGLAAILGWEPERIRVVAPDVGGGFGVKNRPYPEDALAVFLAVRYGRPVKWVGDRREEFLSTNQERDQIHHASIGVDREGRIVAVCDRFVQDNGAYCMSGLVVPTTTGVSLPGPYRVPNLAVEGSVVVTNKVPIGPYRGAGRPQGTFVMERLLDFAADELGLDRVEIRRRNLLRPEDLPFRTGPSYGGAPLEVREGDFPACLDLALAALRPEEVRSRRRGDLWLGVGVANYLEISAGMGFEGARLTVAADGTVEVATGSASQGHGHPTMLAQIAADRLELDLDRIRVREGDTALIPKGVGTFGSRTTVLAGNAVAKASTVFRQKALAAAAELLEADVQDLVWDKGVIHVQGVPDRPVRLEELARDPEVRQRLVAEEYFAGDGDPTLSMGTHALVVAVDPATLKLTILRYVIAHDSGTVVNPLGADGQTIGATVQGLGTALFEELLVDPTGQPLNTSFMDYLLPGAVEMPDFELHELDFPALGNPEGFKGLAEGGIMPPMSAVLAAIEDAIGQRGLRLQEIPMTPSRLHQILQAEEVRA